ncbi:MAG TPA: MarP family serine protease [Solirubrobacteraceae bacterium]|nr:MarP family serine protease [Solirubrobacteraceae bacterium]
MTLVDWIIVVFVVLLAVYGFLQGFLVGALSLLGFAAGAFVGTRVGPLVLSGGDRSHYAPLFGLLGALIAGGLLAAGLEGVGLRARAALRFPGLRAIDGVLGGLLTACVGLGIAWIVGSIALQSAGSRPLRRDIQRSVILQALNHVLPPSGPILNALARFDPLPSVSGPAAGVSSPPKGILAAPGVQAAKASVVRILGTACGLGIEGSGWVAGPGLVVTNAHVVAGETDTVVQVGGQPPDLSARPLVFDPHDDIAVLRVPGLSRPALSLASHPASGTAGAIEGYPLDGPLNLQPARIGATQVVSTQDAYGNGPVLRSITPLRGLVRPGNSGGPLVDAGGRVLGTVFAAITGSAGGGFAVPDDKVSAQLARARAQAAPVSSGACAQ